MMHELFELVSALVWPVTVGIILFVYRKDIENLIAAIGHWLESRK